jgi:hypothetical protein
MFKKIKQSLEKLVSKSWKTKFTIAASALALAATPCSARTLYVSKDGDHFYPFNSWENAATSIQDAVDAANDNDTVLVNDGTYQPETTIEVNKKINIQSLNGKDSTVIDGRGEIQCIHLNDDDCNLDGFTVSFGSGWICGGVWLEKGTVQNCEVRECYSESYGAGLYSQGGGTVLNTTFTLNVTPGAGAGILADHNSVVLDCNSLFNFAKEGAGAYIRGSFVTN